MTEIEIRRKIIDEIPQAMRWMGHNYEPGCLCCLTAKMIAESLGRREYAGTARICEDGVMITEATNAP